MSKFFDQYNAVLEKSLQQVRLKVDPLNKYAEDFSRYDGYVGYILAETEDEIKFFHNNKTLIIPKAAVVVEGILSGLAGTAQPGDSSARTALGTIGRSIAGTATRAVFGSGVTGASQMQQSAAPQQGQQAQNATLGQRVGMTKIPQEMWGKSFNIKNKKSTAYIVARGNGYFITQIKLTNGSGRIMESKSFKEMADAFSVLLEVAANPSPQPPPLPTQQTQQPAPNTAPVPAPTKQGIRFVDIVAKPEFINEGAFITILEQKSNVLYQGYGQLTKIPNTNDFAIGFASVQP